MQVLYRFEVQVSHLRRVDSTLEVGNVEISADPRDVPRRFVHEWKWYMGTARTSETVRGHSAQDFTQQLFVGRYLRDVVARTHCGNVSETVEVVGTEHHELSAAGV